MDVSSTLDAVNSNPVISTQLIPSFDTWKIEVIPLYFELAALF